jgi:hypothetical protein
MAAEELRGRVDDDVRPVLEGADEVRRRDRVVDDERHTGRVRHVGDEPDVEDVDLRVADGLREEQLRVRTHGAPPLLGVVLVLDEGGLDPELRERVLEEVVRTAVDRGGRHDVVARLRDVQHGGRLGSLTGREEERTRSALECGEPLLDDGLRRVLDTRVDVAELREREEVLRVVGVVEHVARGLVDRRRPGLRDGIGRGSRVDLLRLELPVVRGIAHDGWSPLLGWSVLLGCRVPPVGRSVRHPCRRGVPGRWSVVTPRLPAPPRRANRAETRRNALGAWLPWKHDDETCGGDRCEFGDR